MKHHSSYGDYDNVTKDVKTLNDILGRQGNKLLLDVIAEHVGNCVNNFKLNEEETKRLRDSLLSDLKEAILERT